MCNHVKPVVDTVCAHANLKHCVQCDKVACLVCGKEWGGCFSVPYYPAPIHQNPYYVGDVPWGGNTTFACSEDNNLQNHG